MAGVVLPPAWTAEALRAGADLPTGLVTGLWGLKALLVGLGLAGWALRGWLPRDSAPTGTAPAWGMILLLGAGLALRLPGLGDGLWYDEIQTLVDYVRLPMGQLVTTFDSTNQHLLFSVGARVTTVLLGESAFALRLPAALFGVASLWAAVWFGRRWLPAREAWWSAIILAVSYHHVWFSQNARGYTGLLLGTLVATGLFSDLLRPGLPPTSRRVWSYAIAAALTVLTHVTALVLLAGHAVVWLARNRRLEAGRPRWAPAAALMLAGAIALACYAPVLPQLLEAVGSSGTSAPGVAWQRPGWFLAETVSGLVQGIPLGIVVVPIAGLVVLAGLADAGRHHRTVLALMVLPMAILATLLLATGHNLWPRFFFFGAGFVVQWAVHGGFVVLGRLLPNRAVTIGSTGLGVVVAASLLLLPRAWSPKQDYPAAVDWVAAHAAPGDAVVATAMLDLPINRWLGHDWPVVTDLAELRAIERRAAASWVAYTFPIRLEATAPELWRHLSTAYEEVRVIPASIGGGAIVIVRRENRGPNDR